MWCTDVTVLWAFNFWRSLFFFRQKIYHQKDLFCVYGPHYLTEKRYYSTRNYCWSICAPKYICYALLLIPVFRLTNIDIFRCLAERRSAAPRLNVGQHWTAVTAGLARPRIFVSTLPCIQNDVSLSHLPRARAVLGTLFYPSSGEYCMIQRRSVLPSKMSWIK